MKSSIPRVIVTSFVVSFFCSSVTLPIFARDFDLADLEFLPAWGTANNVQIRIRTSPSLDGAIVGMLNTGDRVRCFERSAEKMQIGRYLDYWYRIGKVENADPPIIGAPVQVDSFEKESMFEGWAYGAFIRPDDTNLDRHLVRAAKNGSPGDVRQLLAAGANPNATERQRRKVIGLSGGVGGFIYPTTSALLYGIRGSHTEVARLLVAAGADVNSSVDGVTALRTAIQSQNPTLIELLLDHGVRPDDGSLFEAVTRGQIESVRGLVRGGANVDAAVALIGYDAWDEHEIYEPVVATAVRMGHIDVAEYLIFAGAAKIDTRFFCREDSTDRETRSWLDDIQEIVDRSNDQRRLAAVFQGQFDIDLPTALRGAYSGKGCP